jgi:hypothetical protein
LVVGSSRDASLFFEIPNWVLLTIILA